MKPLAAFACLVSVASLAACAGQPAPATSASTPAAVPATPAPAPAASASAPAAPAAASAERLVVDFDTASAALSPDALAKLDKAGRLYRDAKPAVMTVSGHTDATGGEFLNLLLSARRAEAVKTALVDRGIPADRLQVEAIGVAEPAAGDTPSRVAVITWR